MNNLSPKQQIFIYTLAGVLTGLLFPLMAIIFDAFSSEESLTINRIILLHRQTPFYWLIDFMPLIMGIVAYLLGRSYVLKMRNMTTKLFEEQLKNELSYEFTEQLRSGEIDAEYKLEDKHDELGKSLIMLRDDLKKRNEEEEKRRREDYQRHWATEGIAKFSEILRQHNDNMEVMSYQVISNLVKYVDAIQGGFFILNDQNPNERYFEQTACYAYDRKKFSEKRIDWGEGLIGACGKEQETVYIEDVTEGYVNITSGLGRSNPRTILIVPLKVNEEVHGVIELASFSNFEKFQIEFVEKLAESIASTISSFKINDRTAQLLKESQDQAKKMAQQEELLRKNLEELQITQEEAAKQSEEFISFTNSVNHTLIRAEYATDGTLLYANTKFLQKLGYSGNSEVEGRHISMFINDKDLEWFNDIWDKLAKGGRHFEDYMKHVTKDGKDLWTMATYTCVRSKTGDVEKILFLAIDTTEEKKQSLDYEGQIEALNRSSIKAEYSPAGSITNFNDKFLEALGYSAEEVDNKSVFDFLDEEQIQEFKNIWNNVVNEIPYEGQIKCVAKNGDEHWFHGTFIAVNDMYGEVSKVIYIANDITEQKRMELQTKKQTEQLKIQEEKLQRSGIELSKKLEGAREEMKRQFKKIEIVKMLNEKTLEGALDAIVSINRDGAIEFFNKAAEDLWGVEREKVIGENIAIIIPEEYKDNNDNYIGNFLKPGEVEVQSKRSEVFIVNKSGETIPVLLTLSEARVGREYRLTAFIQNIEVELF